MIAGPLALLALTAPANAADLGISSFSVTPSSMQAAGHPNLTIATTFANPSDNLENVAIHLPPGLVGNPNAATKCSQADFAADNCPATSKVGSVSVDATATILLVPTAITAPGDVYDVAPSPGEPARLGAWVRPLGGILGKIGLPVQVSVRPTDFGLDTTIQNVPTSLSGIPTEIDSMSLTLNGATAGGDFVTLPSSCTPATTRIVSASWCIGVDGTGERGPPRPPRGVSWCPCS